MNNKSLVFYHRADFDGICSGAIVKKYLEEKYRLKGEVPVIHCIGVDYGDDLGTFVSSQELKEADYVFITDFSFEPKDMKLIYATRPDTIWIDHHESAINKAKEHGYSSLSGIRKIETIPGKKISACELAWLYLFPEDNMPYAVHHLGRYDVWDHEDPSVLEYQYGARAIIKDGTTDTAWDALLADGQLCSVDSKILTTGQVILDFERSQNARIAEGISFTCEFHGFRALAANRSHSNSNFFESVFDPEKHDLMLLFSQNKFGGYKVSLYTPKDNVDILSIAESYGGGGHAKACGFFTDTLEIFQK